MLIRCTRCQALFSLQDGVTATGTAFQVVCGRCLLRFAATPSAPPQKEPASKAHVAAVAAPPRPPDPGVLERKAQADVLAKALRPRRPEDERSDLERELLEVAQRRRRRIRWGLGALGLAALALLVLGLRARFFAVPRAAMERVEQARELLLRDDQQSLQQAIELFTEAAKMAAGEAMPEGERGFAMLLSAAARKDLAERLETERLSVAARAASAPADQRAQLEQQVAQLAQEREENTREATRLSQTGVAAAKAALSEDAQDPAALRAVALHGALIGGSDRAALERIGTQDGWALLVKALAERKSPDAALAALALARQAEPRLLRAQVETAAISMDRQEQGTAREELARVLQQNPKHERARRMLLLLPAAPQ